MPSTLAQVCQRPPGPGETIAATRSSTAECVGGARGKRNGRAATLGKQVLQPVLGAKELGTTPDAVLGWFDRGVLL